MFCENCGKQIPDDAKLCPYCGHAVEDEPSSDATPDDRADDLSDKIVEATIEQEKDEDHDVPDKQPGNQPEQPAGEPSQQAQSEQPQQTVEQAPAANAYVGSFDPMTGRRVNNGQQNTSWDQGFDPMTGRAVNNESNGDGKRKRPKFVIPAAVIAACAVAVCAVGGHFYIEKYANKDTLLAVDGDELKLYKGIHKEDPKEFTISDDLDEDDNYFRYSSHGKYIYFATDIKDDHYTLNRIKASSVKSDENKNDKKIEEVADDIMSYPHFYGDDKVVYVSDDNDLCYFNGKDTIEIDDDIYYGGIEAVKDGRVLYLKEKDDEGELYTAKLAKDSDSDKVDDDFESVVLSGDDYVIYSSNTDDDGSDLIRTDMSGKKETIAKNVYLENTRPSNDELWYSVEGEKSVPLADCYTDKEKSSDASAKEPECKDYMTEVNFSELFNGDYSRSEVIDELVDPYYTDDDFYYLDGYYFFEMCDDGTYEDSGKCCEQGDYDDQFFTAAYNPDTDKFYKYDDDSYDNAVSDYQDIDSRNVIRDEIKGETVDVPVYDIYFYHDGKSVKAAEEVQNIYARGNLALFTKASDGNSVTVGDISDYTGTDFYGDPQYTADDLKDAAEEQLSDASSGDDAKYYISVNGKAPSEFDYDGGFLSVNHKQDTAVYVKWDNDGDKQEIESYTVTSDSLKNRKSVSKKARYLKYEDGKFFFIDDYDTDDYEGKLSYWDGKGTVEVMDDTSYDCSFGKISGNRYAVVSDGELYISDGKDRDRVDKKVNSVTITPDGKVLYMHNDDIYRVNKGKTESDRIINGVDSFTVYNGTYVY